MRITTEYLILGASAGAGFAFSLFLMQRGIPFTLLVSDQRHVAAVFAQKEHIEIVVGNDGDPLVLNRATRDKKYIFLGNGHSWLDWQKKGLSLVRNLIAAAAGQQVTLIYPGAVLQFPGDKPITERSAPRPLSQCAALEVKLEDMLLDAVVAEKCRVLIIRLGELYGPGLINGDLKAVFINALNKKENSYPVNIDIPRQFVYTEDATEVIFRLLQSQRHIFFGVFNYAGETYASARRFLDEIHSLAGSGAPVKALSKRKIQFLSLFGDSWKELRLKTPYYELPFLLDDSHTRKLLPDFKPTGPREAIGNTLQWFRNSGANQ
jgi:nucleoside-diphosphate-sugar epimerase